MTDGRSDRPSDEDGDENPEPGRFYATAATFYFLLALASVVWIGLERGSIPGTLFVRPEQLAGDVLLGLATGLLIVAGTWLTRRWPPMSALEERLRSMLVGVTRAEAVSIAVISGFAEELFFRGAVQGSWGWLWATLLFALMHMGPDRPFGWWMVFALIAGGALGWLTVQRGALLPAILAHVTINGFGLLRLVSEPPPRPSGNA